MAKRWLTRVGHRVEVDGDVGVERVVQRGEERGELLSSSTEGVHDGHHVQDGRLREDQYDRQLCGRWVPLQGRMMADPSRLLWPNPPPSTHRGWEEGPGTTHR